MLEIPHSNKGKHFWLVGHCINRTALIVIHWPSLLKWKAVRELPPIKYAKRLGNQVLSSMNILEAGCDWFGSSITLVCPRDDTGTEEERRSYLEWVRVFLHFLLICFVSLSIKLSFNFVCFRKTHRDPNRGPTTLFKCLSELILQREQLSGYDFYAPLVPPYFGWKKWQ